MIFSELKSKIAFVDTQVNDYQTLIDALDGNTEVVLISVGDGLQQMADALAGRSGMDAIHVLSHGSSGAFQLGTSTLSNTNINTYTSQIATIGQSLGAGGDLLLYGCNVAQGDTGRAFIGQIAKITGANVAASTNVTGAAALGGDWELEYRVGAIKTIALNAPDWQGTLANQAPVINNLNNKVDPEFKTAI